MRSTGEKGRLNGKMYSQPAPTAAIALNRVSRRYLLLWCTSRTNAVAKIEQRAGAPSCSRRSLTLCISSRKCTTRPTSSMAGLYLVQSSWLQANVFKTVTMKEVKCATDQRVRQDPRRLRDGRVRWPCAARKCVGPNAVQRRQLRLLLRLAKAFAPGQ